MIQVENGLRKNSEQDTLFDVSDCQQKGARAKTLAIFCRFQGINKHWSSLSS